MMLVGKDTQEYSLSDIEVIAIERKYNGVHWAQALELEGGFRVGTSIYREPEITSFGLWAKHGPCGLSWEWFNVDASSPLICKKLQASSAVSVEYHETEELKAIVAVHFDTDISLRLNENRKEKCILHNTFQRTAALSHLCC